MFLVNIELVATYLSLIFTMLVVIVSLFNYIKTSRKIDQAKEDGFQKALDASDLNTLGNYLDETLGRFTIQEITTNPTASLKVKTYFGRVKDFLGAEKEIKQISSKPRVNKQVKVSGEFEKIIEELDNGEAWNSLARLRRYIEIKLRELAEKKGLRFKRQPSAGRLLNELLKKDFVSPRANDLLRYSISVANSAVRGEDVSFTVAQHAIFSALRGLDIVEK